MGIGNKDDPGSMTEPREKSTSWHVGVSPLSSDFPPGVLAHVISDESGGNFCPAVKKKKGNNFHCSACAVDLVCAQHLHRVKT